MMIGSGTSVPFALRQAQLCPTAASESRHSVPFSLALMDLDQPGFGSRLNEPELRMTETHHGADLVFVFASQIVTDENFLVTI